MCQVTCKVSATSFPRNLSIWWVCMPAQAFLGLCNYLKAIRSQTFWFSSESVTLLWWCTSRISSHMLIFGTQCAFSCFSAAFSFGSRILGQPGQQPCGVASIRDFSTEDSGTFAWKGEGALVCRSSCSCWRLGCIPSHLLLHGSSGNLLITLTITPGSSLCCYAPVTCLPLMAITGA